MQVVIKNLLSEMEEENVAAILKRFGDEQSTLLDKYERLSFEVQLNHAMLGRSLSEPAVHRCQPPPQLVVDPVRQGSRRRRRRGSWAFQKVVKKFLGPFLGKQSPRKDDHEKMAPCFGKHSADL